MLLHGLGTSRAIAETTHWSMNRVAEGFLVDQGYVVLTFDARAMGASAGMFTLDGPREVQDVRELETWLAAQPDVNPREIGAAGVSYGGGALWLAAVQGVPFAAIVQVATWVDLGYALFPQGLAKTGLVAGFVSNVPAPRWDPALLAARDALFLGTATPALQALVDARSVLPRLGDVHVPVFLIQGRRDFAFDMSEATRAFAALRTPKRLYLGDVGHPPSANPNAEATHYLTELRQWFDRWLKGERNGIDTRPPVEVAPDPWTGRTYSYPALPPTRRLAFAAPLRGTIAPSGVLTAQLGRVAVPTEQFGAPIVRATVVATGGFSRLTATLVGVTPGGKRALISAGGVPLRAGRQTVSIRLLDDATPLPRGSRLEVALASSTAHTAAGLLYLDLPLPPGAKLSVAGSVQVDLPVLVKPISP
jgi:predicted acyl esterase